MQERLASVKKYFSLFPPIYRGKREKKRGRGYDAAS